MSDFEVELKARLTDPPAFRDEIAKLQIDFGPSIQQDDLYFAHPARDFGQTDEALRLRRVGDSVWITYKGPKLDVTTKTRKEIEIPLSTDASSFNAGRDMLLSLGFQEFISVAKTRRTARAQRHDRSIEISWDVVEGLGEFAELEVVTDEQDVGSARDAILAFAQELGLGESERRSYAELVLAGKAS